MGARHVVGGMACIAALAGGLGWSGLLPLPFRVAAQETSPPDPDAKPPARTVRMLAVGDLMLGTSVKQTILKRGPRFPFRKYAAALQAADLAFGNLETPLSERGAPTPGKSAESLRNRTNFIFRTPTSAAEGLKWAGFDILSIANNHTMDYGADALEDTVDAVRESSMAPVGGGMNLEEAGAPVFIERNGQRFAFLAISDILPAFSVADEDSPGVAPARGSWFAGYIPEAIAAARKEADRVIVSVHWGKERFTGATKRQTSLGRKLIDWGADVVIGHHTHCLGPVEHYEGGLIHYSLGNFISSRTLNGGGPAWEVTFPPGEPPTERSLTLGR